MLRSKGEMELDENAGTKKEDGVLRCPNCSSDRFEVKRCFKFQKTHTIIFGQEVPTADPRPLILLECPICGKVIPPTILPLPIQEAQKVGYYDFIDKLEQTLPPAKK